MPYINVKVTTTPDPALSSKIADRLSQLTKDHLRKDPTITAVAVEYLDPRHWFAGGRSIADQKTNTFWLGRRWNQYEA